MRKAAPAAIASNANNQAELGGRLSVLAFVFVDSFAVKQGYAKRAFFKFASP